MTQLSRFVHTRALIYALGLALAFGIGSAAIVVAAPPESFAIVRIADRADTTRMAAVDAAGRLAVAQSGPQTGIILQETRSGGCTSALDVSAFEKLRLSALNASQASATVELWEQVGNVPGGGAPVASLVLGPSYQRTITTDAVIARAYICVISLEVPTVHLQLSGR